MKKILALLLLLAAPVSAQQTGLAPNMPIKTDANGYVIATAYQITAPASAGTLLSNTFIKTDASGYLLVAIADGSSLSFATVTATTAVVLGAATTSGIRLDLETGTLAVREGDDSAYGPMRASIYSFVNGSRLDDEADGQIDFTAANGTTGMRIDVGNASGTAIFRTLAGSATASIVQAGYFKSANALITATNGGATAAFTANMVGSTNGPVTAAQNGWVRMQDDAGATFWVPAWK